MGCRRKALTIFVKGLSALCWKYSCPKLPEYMLDMQNILTTVEGPVGGYILLC